VWFDDSHLVGLKFDQGTILACYSDYYTWPIPNGLFHARYKSGRGAIVIDGALRLVHKEVPLWNISAILLLVAPVPPLRRFEAFLKRAIAAKRHQIGFCASCGYDLRATRDRCPECGLVPAVPNRSQ
jgi:hypothetical protein